MIGFDADDTLWRSEDAFQVAEERFVELLPPFTPSGIDLAAALRQTERANLSTSGYGVKAFALSMVQCAITVSSAEGAGNVIGRLVDLGYEMLTEPVQLLPHVPEVLAEVGRDHRLLLLTKGDLVHQTRKITTSVSSTISSTSRSCSRRTRRPTGGCCDTSGSSPAGS